ncbi:hypothetical protein SAMN05192583_3167 [Sphingomonas gellani]|uniref:Uncharacterized protein n=1 Tax=Sphingomonas gellani TaxID=1166340 RepID=A0A1H8I0N8_9SPHN|nr:hypothetical protein [Sphingomonas gellani]SEN61952.1 hypothetical protein SAMN05192583_3167 [Sphingomonas gellani]
MVGASEAHGGPGTPRERTRGRCVRTARAALLSGPLLFAPLLFACADPTVGARARLAPVADASVAPVTLRHVDHLFAEAVVGGEQVGVLNIYSVAPDYRFAIEPREGYACVDDAARAMVLLSAIPQSEPARLRQLDLLTRFVLRMQADNGYFHNFIWAPGPDSRESRINREYRTSLAELNWWSLRALWGLEAALGRLPAGPTATRAKEAADRLVANLVRDLPTGDGAVTGVEGVAVPTWLPFGSGADAGSTAMLGLLAHYRRTEDPATRALVERLGDGLVRMQAGDARHFPYGAHLSWRNGWHGWGNAQAYALLRAGATFGRRDFTQSALAEIDGFYPYLLDHGMLSSFSIRVADGRIEPFGVQRFPQIAYGLSPMILAATEAYRVTGQTRYRDTARRLAGWFGRDNDARRAIYDPVSGRVLDGINAPSSVSGDSGAESTVEGLLALTALHGTPLP